MAYERPLDVEKNGDATILPKQNRMATILFLRNMHILNLVNGRGKHGETSEFVPA
jgi:hypothetical protein